MGKTPKRLREFISGSGQERRGAGTRVLIEKGGDYPHDVTIDIFDTLVNNPIVLNELFASRIQVQVCEREKLRYGLGW